MNIDPKEYVGALTMAFSTACEGKKPSEWTLEAGSTTNEKGQSVYTFKHLRDEFAMTVTDIGVMDGNEPDSRSFNIENKSCSLSMNIAVPACWKNIRL